MLVNQAKGLISPLFSMMPVSPSEISGRWLSSELNPRTPSAVWPSPIEATPATSNARFAKSLSRVGRPSPFRNPGPFLRRHSTSYPAGFVASLAVPLLDGIAPAPV